MFRTHILAALGVLCLSTCWTADKLAVLSCSRRIAGDIGWSLQNWTSATESFWPGRLDYVTYSPGRLEVKGAYLITNQDLAMLEGASELPELVSDHAMLVVDVAGVEPTGR